MTDAGAATAAGATAGSASKPAAGMAVIVIDSTPAGAEVFAPDGKSVGKTPVKLELPISDMPLSFELRLQGYKKKTKELIVSGNTMVQVPLERVRRPGGSGTRTNKSNKEPSGDELERPD